jgi:tetratricopeptide (TPR) repeat protein
MGSSDELAKRMATLGESLRQVGNYSGAIACFTQAIEAKDNYWWAYARRASARGPLGDYCGALEDFNRAKDYYDQHNKAWFLAQKGELFRLWARAALVEAILFKAKECNELRREISSSDLSWDALIQRAIDLFTEAAHESAKASDGSAKCNPWILAHRGAAYTMRYWIRTDTYRLNPKPIAEGRDDGDFENAKKDFSAATQANPSYGWVFAFLAVLSAVRCFAGESRADTVTNDVDQAMFYIGKAQMCGLDRHPSMLRAMMELSIYMGGKMSNPEDAKRAYHNGVQFAWQTLQVDTEETFARYFAADGLKQLERLGEIKAPMVDAAIMRARSAVDGMTARVLAMSGGLDCLSGDLETARKKLTQIREFGDLEALTLVSRDPAWRQLREEAAGGPRRQQEVPRS